MTQIETLALPSDAYSHKDIEIVSEIICEILSECYDIVPDSLSFSIEVSFTRAEEEEV
jgi:hypothetical protein